ncbi:MAG: hypothetical protein QXI12_13595, partial [Candidatus Methanomethyliaceae archaeon]
APRTKLCHWRTRSPIVGTLCLTGYRYGDPGLLDPDCSNGSSAFDGNDYVSGKHGRRGDMDNCNTANSNTGSFRKPIGLSNLFDDVGYNAAAGNR